MSLRPIFWSWSPVPFPDLNGCGRAKKSPRGDQLPESLEDVFSDESVQVAVMAIDRIKRAMEKARASWNPHLPPRASDLLDEAAALLAGAIPWSLCEECLGLPKTDGSACSHCMGSGFLPMFMRGLDEPSHRQIAPAPAGG